MIDVENHGVDRAGQLTWGMLADIVYGVGSFLEREACWAGQWTITVQGLGNIGRGYVEEKVDNKPESTLAGTAVETA